MARKMYRPDKPLGKNFERLMFGVAIMVIILVVAKCNGMIPE